MPFLSVVVVATILALQSSPVAADLTGQRDWSLATSDVLGQSHINTGNEVGFWQAYLATYGQLACNGGIDGHFGSQTAQGTKNIQTFFGLTSDGIVGPNTWHAASGWLNWNGQSFITTFWIPPNGGVPHAMFSYVYSGPWYWQSFGVFDFEADYPTNHPGISFQTTSWC